MEVLNILPQNIFKFKCSEELLNNTLESIKKETWRKNNNNYFTENTRLNKKDEYKELYDWIYKCLNEVKEHLNYECTELKVTQSWANKSDFQMWHPDHFHPNAVISSILYLTQSNSKTWFILDNIWFLETFRLFYGEHKKNNKVTYANPSVSGDLIIFPSTLFHAVSPIKDPFETRYSISFNAYPNGKIGQFGDLSGLNISVS